METIMIVGIFDCGGELSGSAAGHPFPSEDVKEESFPKEVEEPCEYGVQ